MDNLQIVIQLLYCNIHKAATREGMQHQLCKLVNSRKASEKVKREERDRGPHCSPRFFTVVLDGKKRE